MNEDHLTPRGPAFPRKQALPRPISPLRGSETSEAGTNDIARELATHGDPSLRDSTQKPMAKGAAQKAGLQMRWERPTDLAMRGASAVSRPVAEWHLRRHDKLRAMRKRILHAAATKVRQLPEKGASRRSPAIEPPSPDAVTR